MTIQTTDARGYFTKKLIDVYKERKQPTQFLKSFFPDTPPTATLEISIEVMRASELIAVDVLRGTDGNRNTFSKSTEKIFIPPYFKEYFDITNLDFYKQLWGSAGEISDAMLGQLVLSAAEKYQILQDKIDRTYEKQRGEVLMTGIMTLNQGVGQIDFKRKAGSKVDLTSSGGYWATNNDLFAQIQAGGTWIRQNGQTGAFKFDLILGETAATDFFKNTVFTSRQNLFSMKLDNINPPQANVEGGVYHGTITAGPYVVNVWSYSEQYKDRSGNFQYYLDPKYAVMLPSNPRFKMAYAAVPQLLNPGQPPKVGKYVFRDFVDEKAQTHEYYIESAGMPIPVAVDQIYTMKAVTG